MTDQPYENDRNENNENEDFSQMLEASLKDQAKLEPGQLVDALVVRVSAEWVFIDVGRKGEGIIEKAELLDADGSPTVKEGDKVRAYFLPGKRGELRFTTRIGTGPAAKAQLENAREHGIPVEGTVAKEIKGGFEISISGGTRAFCPFSLMGLRKDEDRAACVGRSYTFKVTECKDRNFVVSRRAILDEEREEKARGLKGSLKAGMRIKGTVTSIRDFGAFVDIGGMDGLIPISEIAWGRTAKVSDKLKVGQEIETVIKRLDWEADRISLSLKDALPDPWDEAGEKFALGSYHGGTVTRLAPFGAFVGLGEGIEGLIPISKLGGERRITHPREVLKEGQEIEVRVEAFDRAKKRLSLSLASVSRAEEEERDAIEVYRKKAVKSSGGLGTLGELLGGSQKEEEKP